MRRSVGRTRAPASIPKQPGRAARFADVGAAGQIGSRTDLPHCTSRHHVDVAEARDWPLLSESVRISRIDERLSPYCVGALPEISARTSRAGVAGAPGPNPSPFDAGTNLRTTRNRASADISSG